MNRITITIAEFIALAGAVGCNPSAPNASQAKVEAYQRWNLTRASMLVGVGEEQFKTGDLDNARNSGREALALSPELTAAQILLARVCIEKGNYIEAQNTLDAAAAHEPKNAKIMYLKAVTL